MKIANEILPKTQYFQADDYSEEANTKRKTINIFLILPFLPLPAFVAFAARTINTTCELQQAIFLPLCLVFNHYYQIDISKYSTRDTVPYNTIKLKPDCDEL